MPWTVRADVFGLTLPTITDMATMVGKSQADYVNSPLIEWSDVTPSRLSRRVMHCAIFAAPGPPPLHRFVDRVGLPAPFRSLFQLACRHIILYESLRCVLHDPHES